MGDPPPVTHTWSYQGRQSRNGQHWSSACWWALLTLHAQAILYWEWWSCWKEIGSWWTENSPHRASQETSQGSWEIYAIGQYWPSSSTISRTPLQSSPGNRRISWQPQFFWWPMSTCSETSEGTRPLCMAWSCYNFGKGLHNDHNSCKSVKPSLRLTYQERRRQELICVLQAYRYFCFLPMKVQKSERQGVCTTAIQYNLASPGIVPGAFSQSSEDQPNTILSDLSPFPGCPFTNTVWAYVTEISKHWTSRATVWWSKDERFSHYQPTSRQHHFISSPSHTSKEDDQACHTLSHWSRQQSQESCVSHSTIQWYLISNKLSTKPPKKVASSPGANKSIPIPPGERVRWKKAPSAYHFLDGDHDHKQHPGGPQLLHFHSASIPAVYQWQKESWKQILCDSVNLPTPQIQL